MVIWNGLGILIGLLGLACGILVQVGVNAAMQDDKFFVTHWWPKLLAGVLAAAVSWPVGRWMNRTTEQELIDPQTGKTVVLRSGGKHSLFFIPVQYWWIVFLALGAVYAAVPPTNRG